MSAFAVDFLRGLALAAVLAFVYAAVDAWALRRWQSKRSQRLQRAFRRALERAERERRR